MCGISGLVDFSLKSSFESLKNMTDVLSHRGPDGAGYHFDSIQTAQVGLGHRRLSIIDLSSDGIQPMIFQDIVIVFNGEIYNYKEIRAELEGFGYEFNSCSDTEVLLKAYHKWGLETVARLNGMFAFVLYDKRVNRVFLVRDRAGVKPLYWFYRNGLFLFASELKSFHQENRFSRRIDSNSLSLFLKFGYVPEPHSIFENTQKLQAGHILQLNLDNKEIKINKYWDVVDFYSKRKIDISEDDAIAETTRLLHSACEYRMIADVPVGVFLSGGYDSSTVAAILQSSRTAKIKTFSIGFFEKDYNEAHHARRVAEYLGTDHTEYYCTTSEAVSIIPKIAEIWDEPFADVSAIPTVLVSQLARKTVKVSLSADGGDELFGGYYKYNQAIALNRYLNKIPLKGVIDYIFSIINPEYIPFVNKIDNFCQRFEKIKQSIVAKNIIDLLSLSGSAFTTPELGKLLGSLPVILPTNFDVIKRLSENFGNLDALMCADYLTYQLDDILTKVDRATMSVGLEGREPFLDYRLIQFVAQLRPELKIKNGVNKYLLKRIAHKYLPQEIMDRPKMGFGVPINSWLKGDLEIYLDHYLSVDRLKSSGLYDVQFVERLVSRFKLGYSVNVSQIWNLLIFEMWRDRWVQ